MEKIDNMIRDYYAGTISQDEMDDLCRMFLDSEDVRMSHPAESRVLVSLALARMAHGRRKKSARRTWRVAACIAVVLLLGGGIYARAADTPHTYSSDPSFTSADVEQWYNKTLETAI
ncbi:MAG: hypothetical protein IKJ78_06260 [Bacteroidales bacterium]|nr:hypothetical protein [Bacteroidales bacterium]